MQTTINGAVIALAASLLIISTSGCASTPVAPASSPAPAGAIRLEQPAMTDYMRSRVGTPDELSPLAPAEARNVHKVGNQWVCELNGQTMVFDGANWVPQSK